jgi:methyl-accepting chemotaxis protein
VKLKQSTVTIAAAVAFGLMAVVLAAVAISLKGAIAEEKRAADTQRELQELAVSMAGASDLLTNEVRQYSVTRAQRDIDAYWHEIDVTKTRDKVIARLEELGAKPDELALLDEAKANSDALVETETRAMRLVLEGTGVAPADMPPAVADYELPAADQALSAEQKLALAPRILFDRKYDADKATIVKPVNQFTEKINSRAAAETAHARDSVNRSVALLIALAVLVPLLMGAVLWVMHVKVGKVVSGYSAAIRNRSEAGEVELDPQGTEELKELAAAFNEQSRATAEQLQRNEALNRELTEVAEQVSATAQTVSSSSQQMASTSHDTGRAVNEIASAVGDVAQGAERQVRMVDAVRTSAGEAAETARASADSAREAATVAEDTRSVAREGVGAAEQASTAMESVRQSSEEAARAIGELSQRSKQIGAIVETITGIAEQTNLLALNAAIEAARAGEQGRGFAVVAEEVRKLAEESQQAAGSIAELITEIQSETGNAVTVVQAGAERTEDGTKTVEQTRAAFERIGESVEQLVARVEDISGAVERIASDAGRIQDDIAEVAAVAEESSASTEQVSASTQQTSASAQEIAASAQQLSSTAQELEGMVARLKGAA